jgi:hypothetical protein
MEDETIPEVRQCTAPEHTLFGAVAVKSALPQFGWGVFHPANGGHWAGDDDVEDWPVLKAE